MGVSRTYIGAGASPNDLSDPNNFDPTGVPADGDDLVWDLSIPFNYDGTHYFISDSSWGQPHSLSAGYFGGGDSSGQAVGFNFTLQAGGRVTIYSDWGDNWSGTTQGNAADGTPSLIDLEYGYYHDGSGQPGIGEFMPHANIIMRNVGFLYVSNITGILDADWQTCVNVQNSLGVGYGPPYASGGLILRGFPNSSGDLYIPGVTVKVPTAAQTLSGVAVGTVDVSTGRPGAGNVTLPTAKQVAAPSCHGPAGFGPNSATVGTATSYTLGGLRQRGRF